MNTCNECETVAHCLKHGCIPKVRSTIDMAREAGFTEGELAFMGDNFRRFAELVRADEREQALAAPVQEPVAHINQNGVIHEAGYEWGPTNELTALYATPPAQEFVCSTGLCHYKAQRQWVGLTDEEIKHMLELFVIPPHHVEMVVRAIEAKLKEKNT